MNQTDTTGGNALFLKLQHKFSGVNKNYLVSVVATGIFLVLITVGDILFSYRQFLFNDIIILPLVAIIYAVYNVMVMKYMRVAYLPQVLFLTSCILLCLLYFRNGNLNGSYFYFFPVAMAYFCHTETVRNRSRFMHFYIITALLLVTVLMDSIVYKDSTLQEKLSALWYYRLFAASVMTGMLFRHFLVLQENRLTLQGYGETYYEALFHSHFDAFIVYDKETNEVIDCNRQALVMLELPSASTIKGLYISQVMHRYLSGESPNLDLLMNGLPDNWNGTADFITHNKQQFQAFVRNVVFSKGDREYQIMTIRDITEMKKAEQELKSTKASVEKAAKAKARFLSSMSHELRTPLNGIIGTSNLILSEPNLPENVKNHISVLRYSSEHMLGIINDILDFSKIDAGKMELKKHPFNLKESMDHLVASFDVQFRNKQIDLVTDYHPQLYKLHVVGDKVKLCQVISNLLSNALKFTQSGKVVLKVSIIKASSRKASLLFEVTDTGMGIPKDKLSEIFQGFSQVHAEDLKRDFGGTGLGLTISDKMVNMFGGNLEVESELSKGSRFFFTISLPIADMVISQEINAGVKEAEKDIRGVRILVVEDNEINAGILKTFLKKWEVQLKEATHGLQALELLKYHKFDLILMDLEMPEMDGYTTIKKIRETNKELPVIAFTAALLENMDALICENGFNDYLLKPYRPSELKKKIETYTHRHVDY